MTNSSSNNTLKQPTNTTSSISSSSYCEWTINVTDCIGSEFFKIVYFVSTYFSLFIFLCAVWLLAWRLYSKPQIKLFTTRGFLAMEGFLFTQIFWGGMRVFSCLILVYNIFENNWIIRELSNDVTWLLGIISVATYLAGVIRTIPRMHFYRQNPHYKHSLHLPNLRGVAVVYFSYVFLVTLIVMTCSALTGWLRTLAATSDITSIINLLMVVHYGTYSISCFVVAIGFMIYGRKLVRMANEGLELMESLNEYKSSFSKRSTQSPELELKHKQLKQSVRKMRFIHFAFTSSFMVMGTILGFYAFMHDFLFNNLTVSKVFAATANWMPLLLVIGILIGVTYGEMRIPDKSVPTLRNVITVHPDSIVIHQQQRPSSRSSSRMSHSRETSTDSDAPLLKRPPPTAISPIGGARRFSFSMGSPKSPESPSIPTPPELVSTETATTFVATASSSASSSTTSIV